MITFLINMLSSEQIKDTYGNSTNLKEFSLVVQKWELHWTKRLVRTKKTKKEEENKTLTVKLVSHNCILENRFSTQEE